MAHPLGKLKKWWRWLPLALVAVLLLVSLVLLNVITISPQHAARYQQWHLLVSLAVLALTSIALLYHSVRLWQQWRTQQAGSRFTLRLINGFLVMILLPMVLVSWFAINLVGDRIDRWLAINAVQQGLNDAAELGSLSLSVREQQHLALLRAAAEQLQSLHRADYSAILEKLFANGASEVLLLDSSLQLVAQAVDGVEHLFPRLPDAALFRALAYRNSHYALEQQGDNRIAYRAALKIRFGKPEAPEIGILTAVFPLPEAENSLSLSLQNAQREFNALAFQRAVIKDAFRLSIIMLTALTTLFALWAAFVFSRRLTRPVKTLVEGTLAVAAGDLDKKLPVLERDDFNTLAMSFNTMTKRLSDARMEREQARRQLQQERDYLDAVLEHLTSGVITLDSDGVIRRVNPAASHILDHTLTDLVGKTLAQAAAALPTLAPLFTLAQCQWQAHQATQREWQAELTLNQARGKVILVCRGANLPNAGGKQAGAVILFDDVTDLIQAEHDAAWGEVARRMAHEIKNPLTPIQLSAERLSRKLSTELSPNSAEFLKRMTNTIIQQVDNLKAMVNAFSEYARAPKLQSQPTDLNALVRDVAELYRHNEAQAHISLDLDNNLPLCKCDPHRIRQLLVNLLKNALEALEEQGNTHGTITLATQHQPVQRQIQLSVQDNGQGIPADLLARLFEPYITSKPKGTGLGLAIVKKIVEEHGGHVVARNHPSGGAIISVTLPIQ